MRCRFLYLREAADVVQRRGVDHAGDALREVVGEPHGGVGAVARAHHVDPRLGVAALDVVQQSLHALLARRRVGGDAGEFPVDEVRPGADEEVAAKAVDQPAVLDARIHHARAAWKEDDDVARRGTLRVKDVGHDLAAGVFRRADQLLGGQHGPAGEEEAEANEQMAHARLA